MLTDREKNLMFTAFCVGRDIYAGNLESGDFSTTDKELFDKWLADETGMPGCSVADYLDWEECD